MISKPYIKLKNVSKVFGQNPDTVIDLVQNNIDKAELQNDYNHVIGLQNINIDIPKNNPSLYGSLWIWKIHFDQAPQPTNKTDIGRDNCK